MTEAFKHSAPELYDRFMGPLFFEPCARVIAARVAELGPERILETAAGTGILTRTLLGAVPGASIVATDINPAMLDYAAANIKSDHVKLEHADAQQLGFADASFDLVLCQFGMMFFPDKVSAAAQARRVLKPAGRYMFATFDNLDRNPIAKSAGDAVASLFSEHPRYMERGPFSYADADRIRGDLRAAGFANVDVETTELRTRVTARDAAQGIVLGSPFRAEIEKLDPGALDRALAAVAQALAPFDGKDAPISVHVVSAW